MSKKYRLAIFASGSGTNAEAIITYFKGNPYIEAQVLLTNNPNAYAIERARKMGISYEVFTKQDFQTPDFGERLRHRWGITHVVLAGFLWLIPKSLLKTFPHKIVNIHPALLPKYGGKGMYGMKVHEVVKTSGDLETGITIHLVNDQYDDGEILAQKTVVIEPGDTAADISEKVHKLEYKYYPLVIEAWIKSQDT